MTCVLSGEYHVCTTETEDDSGAWKRLMRESKPGVNNKMYQDCLLKCLKEENLREFEKLLEGKDKYNINAFHVHGKTLLAEASKKGLTEFVAALLNSGADPNIVCRIHFGKAAIHFAAEEGHIDVINCLVNHRSTNKNAIDKQGNTALHLVASNFTVEGKNAEACFSYLASLQDTNIRHRNAKCLSAISMAFEKCSGNCSVDIWQVVLRRSDIRPEDRQLILDKYPDLKVGIPENIETIYTYDDAYTDLRKEELETFKRKFKAEFVDKTELIETTFLQLACKKGLLDIVQLLLEYGADVNQTGTHEKTPPVHLACYFGQYDILKRLLETTKVTINPENKKSLLHSVLEGLIGCEGSTDGQRKCFDYLLEQKLPDIPINHRDIYGNTALHYAARFEDVHYAKELVRHGAYMGYLNEFGFSPLDYISPQNLEEILDNCVECEKGVEDGDYELKFNFSFMNPTESCDTTGQPSDGQTGGRAQVHLPEMSPLNFISRSNKLEHLLKHPVLLVFLHLKWTRIYLMFYINMIYYIIFVIFLTLHILSQTCSDGNYNGNWSAVWVILSVLTVILVVREVMQFYLLPKKWRYFCNLENVMEIPIIAFTILILFGYCYKILAAVTLLLAWMEGMLLLGCFYSLSVYYEMIRRVTLNYMKFLFWNLPLIVAFSFSFYLLYHKKNPSEGNGGTSYVNNTSGNSSFQGNNVDFYSYLDSSLLKTVVMMIGEFDASSMSFDYGSYLVFLCVFLMAIVMTNVLNGIAVSDTQAIKNDAELVVYRYRVTLVDHYESVVFGNSFNNHCMQKLTCELLSLCQGRLQKTLSLFPDSLQGQNKSEQSVVLKKETSCINLYIESSDRDEECRPFTCCKIGKLRIGLDIDREVLIAAKKIADRRQKHSRAYEQSDCDRIAEVKKVLQGCMDQLAKLEELRKQ